MKKLITLLFLVLASFSFSQSTYYWRSEALGSNWNDSQHWWNGAPNVPTGSEILRFDNNVFPSMTNDLGSTNRFQIWFDSGATVSRVITGTSDNTFYDYGGVKPKIENSSIANHTIDFPLTIGYNPMEINPINGDITVTSTLNLQGNYLDIYGVNANKLSLNGLVSGTGGISLKQNSVLEYNYDHTYSGQTSIEAGTFHLNANLINSDIVIFSGAQLIIQGHDISIKSLTVNSGGSVIISPDASLTINGNLVNSGSLILNSTSSNYSSLIVNGTSTGNISYNRHVNSEVNGNDLITSPVSGQLFSDFASANTNLFSNTSNPTEKLFGPFDKSTGTYLTYDTAIPAEANVILNSGIGYRVASDDNAGMIFTGTINSTNVITTITRPAGTNYAAWNLIGNPYPSYLDLGAFYTTNSSQFDPTGGIYGYDGDASDGWLVYNLANSTGVSLAPGQGFFVASQTGGGTVTFTPAMRTTGNSDDFINGRSSENNFGMIKLLATRNQSSYTTEFYFLDNTTLALDQGYDTSVFGGNANGFALYSRLVEDSTNLDMAIQSLPYDSLGSDVMIPLGINLNQGQQVTISIDSMDIPEGIEVYLEDTETNTFTLLNNNEYVFTADSNLSGPGRFYLRFSSEALSIQDNVLDGLSVFASKDIVYIKGQILENTTATLFDIQGRQVISTSLESNSFENTIDVSSISSGVYIVRLQNNNFSSSKKIILE